MRTQHRDRRGGRRSRAVGCVWSWRKPFDLASEQRDLVGCDAGLVELADETAGIAASAKATR